MLPTLGEERQQTYSIFLPISPRTGRVLQVPMVKTDADAGTIAYRDEDGTLVETPVTGGNVKLQWKADWAGRWFALDVDYEMYGKDLIPSAELSAKIVRILGGQPPEGFNYELFLDEEGRRSPSPRATGSRSRSGCATPRPSRWPLHAAAAAPRASGSTSTSSRAPSTTIWRASRSCRPRSRPRRWRMPAWHIHDGKPVDYHSRRRHLRHAAESRRAWRIPRTRTCCGSTCAAMCRAPRRRMRPISTGCCRARWPTTRTS